VGKSAGTPYYQRDDITIYCGDCLGVMPELININLLLSDPPYGANINTQYKSNKRGALAECNDFPPIYGDDKPFNPAPFLCYPKVVLFGANYYADKLPITNSWWIWDKRDGLESKRADGTFNDNGEVEIIWTNLGGPPRIYSHRWMGAMKASEQQEKRVHPTQKPIALMEWCINLAKPEGIICDPYMGSSSTLIAAKNMGYPTVGIELSEDYCKIAIERLRQPSFWSIPKEPEQKPKQIEMDLDE
jgi:site-specific DNA-methyltransferase (adenine-specific)